MPQTTLPLSTQLGDILSHETGAYITAAQLLAGIKSQALAVMLILFALPNVVPSLPGTSAITGLPLVIVCAQMMLGQSLWLPRIIADRAISRAGLVGVLAKANPYLTWIERRLHPRLLPLSSPRAQRILGAGMLVLSVMIMLPIPLGNIVPSAAIVLIGLGMMQRDGVFILVGICAGVAATALVVGVYASAILWALAYFGIYLP